MSTSGVTTFNMTSDNLVTAALRKLAVLGDGQSPSTTQLTSGTEALNVMLKTFQTKGMPLWAIKEYDVPLTSTNAYTIGTGQTVNTPAPLVVLQAILVDTLANNSVPLNPKSHTDFNLLTIGASAGTPVSYWYEPLNQTGVLHVWPTPDNYSTTNRKIKLVYQRPFEDMVSGSNNLDFPQYWQEAIIYGLAYRLSPEYGIPLQDRQAIAQDAAYFLSEALAFGNEEGSMFIQPDWTSL